MKGRGEKFWATPIKRGSPSEAELDEEVAKQRMYYERLKPMWVMVTSNMRIELAFRLPGNVESVTNLHKDEEQALRFRISMAKALQAVDKLIADDAWIRRQIAAGYDVSESIPFESPELREKVFGERGPIEATVGGELEPLFDYQSEVAAANKAYDAMIEGLGLRRWLPRPSHGSLGKTRLAGIRFVNEVDVENRLIPFRTHPGCVIALMVEFKEPFVDITYGAIEKAVADTGQDLRPRERSACKMLRPYSYSQDKRKALLYFQLGMPDKAAAGLKEFVGRLEFRAGTSSVATDLGLADIEVGATGKAFDAKVVEIGPSLGLQGKNAVTLSLHVPQHKVKCLLAHDADGKPILLKYRMQGASSDEHTMFFIGSDNLSSGSRLSVETWSQTEARFATFKITDVSWCGNPLEQ